MVALDPVAIAVATQKPAYELADIFRHHFDDYLCRQHCTEQEFKAVNAIVRCRTAAVGGYVQACDRCGQRQIACCSCKNRHCPKCGHFEKAQWRAEQAARVLPAPHFQVVFTVDHALNDLAYLNPEAIYGLLFRTAGRLLRAFGRRYLGGEIGATMVLHTWGSTLQHHVHLHCLVPAGALVQEASGSRWQASRPDFLLPVVALAQAFRDAFLNSIERLLQRGELRLAGGLTEAGVTATIAQVRKKKWVVYSGKPPAAASPTALLGYLGRYVQQTAIANRRLVEIADGAVTFEFRAKGVDAAGSPSPRRRMKLDAVESIRRFLRHVLPRGFVRIRHYGLYASGMKRKRRLARLLLAGEAVEEAPKLLLTEWLKSAVEPDPLACPACGVGRMQRVGRVRALSRAEVRVALERGLPVLGQVPE